MAYNANFNLYGFYVVGPQVPDSLEIDYTVRHVPGGSVNIVDIGGPKPRTLTLTLFFTAEADYHALLGQIGNNAILTIDEYPSGVNALLVSLVRQERALGTNHETTAQAVFLLT